MAPASLYKGSALPSHQIYISPQNMFENCASTFFKKVYEFVNALVDLYVRPRIGVASRRVLGHERYFVAHFVLQNIAPPAECAGRQHRFGACKYILQAQFSNMFWGLM